MSDAPSVEKSNNKKVSYSVVSVKKEFESFLLRIFNWGRTRDRLLGVVSQQ